MPTGFTAPIAEGRDITFEEFIWRCVRGMGVAIEQRDGPLDVPVRMQVGDGSLAHYIEKANAESERIEELLSLSTEEIATRCANAYREAIVEAERRAKDRADRRRRYEAMIAKVEAWPADDLHEGLKAFALTQLRESLDWDCPPNVPPPEPPPAPEVWRAREIQSAAKSLAYYLEERDKVRQRMEHATRWLAKLAESVPYPWPVRSTDVSSEG